MMINGEFNKAIENEQFQLPIQNGDVPVRHASLPFGKTMPFARTIPQSSPFFYRWFLCGMVAIPSHG